MLISNVQMEPSGSEFHQITNCMNKEGDTYVVIKKERR